MLARLETFQDEKAGEVAAVDWLVNSLAADTPKTLFLSGGTTPAPIYRALARQDLAWAQIHIGLVDERWVDESDKGSNAGLVKQSLLQEKAASAPFWRMKNEAMSACDGQAECEAAYRLMPASSIAVLGMGADGHTASWFANARGLDKALDSKNPNMVQAIIAPQTNVTGIFLERMTLTVSALMGCEAVLLLYRGNDKHALLTQIINQPESDLPIAHAVKLLGDKLTIFGLGVSDGA